MAKIIDVKPVSVTESREADDGRLAALLRENTAALQANSRLLKKYGPAIEAGLEVLAEQFEEEDDEDDDDDEEDDVDDDDE